MAPRRTDAGGKKAPKSGGEGKGQTAAVAGGAASAAAAPANDRFAALAPSNAPSRGSGATNRGSVADRMRQGQGASAPERTSVADRMRSQSDMSSGGTPGGSVAERMRQSAAPASAAPEEKDGQASRARDEVFAEIHELLKSNPAIQLVDFDYRIRQHLHAMIGSGGRTRLHNALTAIKEATAKKTRKDVKNWPAYLGKLLKKVDDDTAWQDREARAKARVEKAAAESTTPGDGAGDGSKDGSKRTTPREISEEDDWMQAISKDLSEEDQWLQDFAAAAPPSPDFKRGKQSAAKDAPSQPPSQPPSLPPSQPPSQPPMMPPTAAPTLPPAREPVLPPTPSKPPQMQPPPETPPTKPPIAAPESDLKHIAHQARHQWRSAESSPAEPKLSISAQKLLHEFQQMQKLQGYPVRNTEPPTTLNFSLEAWAAWLYQAPPQYGTPQCAAR